MISTLSEQEWNRKVIELSGSILQSYRWGEFQAALGFPVHRFSGPDFLAQVLETPLAAGKKYLYCPRGPLGNVETAIREIREFADRDHALVFARIEPIEKQNLPKATKDTQPTHNWLLDLTQTEEQILASMKPKTRYNINLAERKGVTVREGKKEDLLDVYKLLMETAGRGKFRLHPQNYYWEIWEHLHNSSLKVLIAEYHGNPLACMLLTIFGSTATYLHGGSSQSHKDVMAPYLLHWHAIKLSKNLGYQYYDFGGVAPEGQGDHSWSGISRFKRSFGGFELNFPGSYDIIYSPLWYNVYKNARQLRNLIRK